MSIEKRAIEALGGQMGALNQWHLAWHVYDAGDGEERALAGRSGQCLGVQVQEFLRAIPWAGDVAWDMLCDAHDADLKELGALEGEEFAEYLRAMIRGGE